MDSAAAEFEQFVTGSLPELLRFGHVLTGDPHAADDLVQQSLVKTLRRWRRIRHDQPVAYVRRVMVTTHISGWRRLRREAPMPEGLDVADPDDASARFDDRDRMTRALRRLPPRQRAVLVLRYYSEFTEAEIAHALGCSAGTVKSQASKAIRSLRTLLCLEAESGEDLEQSRCPHPDRTPQEIRP